MQALNAWRGSLGLLAVASFSTVLSGCGSDFTCVESRTCPSGVAPGGSAGSSGSGGSGAAGSAGAQGAGVDSGAGDSGSSGTAGEAGSPDGGGNETDAGPDVEAGADTAPDAPSCETEQPDLERGIFVSNSGSDGADGSACGAIGAPCATIKRALGLAKANGVIHLDAGTYEEDGLALVAGVTLQGGWERRVGGAWTRACTPGRESATVIRAKSADRTLSAVDLGGLARLEVLTVRSKLGAAAAEQSLYGVFAAGAATQLTLREVAIDVGNAGAGKVGAAGAAGGRRGRLCLAETGADGAAVGTSGSGALAGSFSIGGYMVASGIEGGAGDDGEDGTAAPAAPCIACKQTSATCDVRCNGATCYLCGWSSSYLECGDAGRIGCAGAGGSGGKPGTGGGSSVGIFVWGATVRLDSGKVRAGRGGDGGTGGPGGQGGAGSPGIAGSAPGVSCETCNGNSILEPGCWIETRAAQPGAPGGPGGSGKAGGPGGGGAGGHSYAIYKGNSAIVNVAAGVELVAGAPGSGGGAAPSKGANGAAKPIGP
jgi:hypothetical protein